MELILVLRDKRVEGMPAGAASRRLRAIAGQGFSGTAEITEDAESWGCLPCVLGDLCG
jgi:hypothetical protein